MKRLGFSGVSWLCEGVVTGKTANGFSPEARKLRASIDRIGASDAEFGRDGKLLLASVAAPG